MMPEWRDLVCVAGFGYLSPTRCVELVVECISLPFMCLASSTQLHARNVPGPKAVTFLALAELLRNSAIARPMSLALAEVSGTVLTERVQCDKTPCFRTFELFRLQELSSAEAKSWCRQSLQGSLSANSWRTARGLSMFPLLLSVSYRSSPRLLNKVLWDYSGFFEVVAGGWYQPHLD